MTFIQFGRDLPLALVGVVAIPKRKIKVINIDPHHKEEKGLVHDLTVGPKAHHSSFDDDQLM